MSATSDLDSSSSTTYRRHGGVRRPKPLPPISIIRASAKDVVALTALTNEGALTRSICACDLRRRGPLANSLEAFETYQAQSPGPGSISALTRARVIHGPAAWPIVWSGSSALRSAASANRQRGRDVAPDMRDRIARPHQPRDLGFQECAWRPVRLDFVAQYLALRHAARLTFSILIRPKCCTGRQPAGLLDAATAHAFVRRACCCSDAQRAGASRSMATRRIWTKPSTGRPAG